MKSKTMTLTYASPDGQITATIRARPARRHADGWEWGFRLVLHDRKVVSTCAMSSIFTPEKTLRRALEAAAENVAEEIADEYGRNYYEDEGANADEWRPPMLAYERWARKAIRGLANKESEE